MFGNLVASDNFFQNLPKVVRNLREIIKNVVFSKFINKRVADMEVLFLCSTLYLASERSERVRYQVKHEKRYSKSTSCRILFSISYGLLDHPWFVLNGFSP